MRATRAATVALTLVLSGSLAVGVSGTAVAGTPNAPSGRTAAPEDTDTARQLRAVKDLSRLAELTGTLGRVTRDHGSAAELTREIRERVDRQVRRVVDAVDRETSPTTLPATDEGSPGSSTGRVTTQIVTVSDASDDFRRSVRQVVTTRHADLKSRNAAADSLLRHLAAVNRAALNEVGIRVGTSTHRSDDEITRKTTITSGVIDRDTLVSGDLGRHDDAVEAITELIEDVREAPGGRLSREDAAEHTAELDEALAPLRRQAAGRGTSTLSTEMVEDLQDRSDSLLDASRTDDARKIRNETRRLMRDTVKLLGAMPAERSVADDEDADEAEDFAPEDTGQMWLTGLLLSPMTR